MYPTYWIPGFTSPNANPPPVVSEPKPEETGVMAWPPSSFSLVCEYELLHTHANPVRFRSNPPSRLYFVHS